MRNQGVGGLGGGSGSVPWLWEVLGEVGCQNPKSMRGWVPTDGPTSTASLGLQREGRDCGVNNRPVIIPTLLKALQLPSLERT